MPLPKGTMTVDILPDGTARIESGDMSGVAHKAADAFYADMARELGGTVTDVKLGHGHHHHTHDHDHKLTQ